MKIELVGLLVLIVCATVILRADAAAYFDLDDELMPSDSDYQDNALENILHSEQQKRASWISMFRRACVPRNGICDHRPKDCCYGASCRCNLWGFNCRCQRVGLFQKWGK
ncbi:U8-agatoxin-Ao1a-like isoform X1 [Trichogramma pretiosum]|uniref:U8-agatoxin-Ao1a-like isoform X1 n=1 Tax=Trichogramma pretiosum TaxID=7493 RepID=UPI0006C9AE45|nr:U8-agatoxin-Ao1a-like isoform X1 [Trichogramma pretiosum]